MRENSGDDISFGRPVGIARSATFSPVLMSRNEAGKARLTRSCRREVDVVKFVSCLCIALCGFAVLVCGCNKRADDAGPTPEAAPASSVSQSAEEGAPDAVLVTVDGKKLTRGMADRMAAEIAARQGVPPQMVEMFLMRAGKQLETQCVEQFVNRTLLEAEVERQKITVDSNEVDAVVAQLSARLPEGTTIEQALAANGVGMDQLRADIQSGERVRKLCESRMVLAEPVTDAQVEEYYKANPDKFKTGETIAASHILISCGATGDETAHATAKAKAEAIRKQIEDGGDFAELAREKSACPSGKDGGALGTFKRGQMVPEFDEAAFGQAVGELGPVIKTSFGYHIVKVTDKQAAGVRALADASGEIRERLTEQAKDELLKKYLDSLKAAAKISYAEGIELPGQ